MSYYISKTVKGVFINVENALIKVLQDEGFGILTVIDIQEKLHEKLNVEFRKYKILGACNPPFAYEALKMEDKIGTMLPCNIIIQEIDKDVIEVAAINPLKSMQAVKNKALKPIALDIKEKLSKALNALEKRNTSHFWL